MKGVFSPFAAQIPSIKSRGRREKRECLLSESSRFSFEKSVECRRPEELDRFNESEVFEVGRMSLDEKIGIGDWMVLLAKPWRSEDSERMQFLFYSVLCVVQARCACCAS